MSEIPLSSPDITDTEIDAVVDVMRSGRLSIGPKQDLFEQQVAARCERSHGVAISSGTAGLHLLLKALGVGHGDEVLTTPFSFIASSNCVLMVGAKPVFVDICPQSLNIDPKRLEAAITDKTKAIIAVEVFGNPQHILQLRLNASLARWVRLQGSGSASFAKLYGERFRTGSGSLQLTLAPTRFLQADAVTQLNTFTRAMTVLARIRWRYLPGSDLFLVFQQNFPYATTESRCLENPASCAPERRAILKLTFRYDALL